VTKLRMDIEELLAFADEHGWPVVVSFLRMIAKPKKPGRSTNWSTSPLMKLWIAVEMETQGKKIKPALEAVFRDKNKRSKFFDAIYNREDAKEDGFKFPSNAKRAADLYYKADRQMQKWKKEGDERYDQWMLELDLARNPVEEYVVDGDELMEEIKEGWRRKGLPSI
jgi:hypothetical protein